KLNNIMLHTQYKQAADAVVQFLETSGETLTLAERFYLRGRRCFCLYHNRDYELARDTVIQLIEEREREGEMDLNYAYDIRTLALAQRGLCQFEECDRLLKDILERVKQISPASTDVTELITELEEEIKNTEKIRRDEAVDVFAPSRVELVGVFGTQTL